ncbi:MAG TPA: ABC transporter substrate-binding protein [Methylomirabilota bacterium]|nr:ABC transporter substrate-binding protein [Methylomirabilota bacterium]
MKVRTIGKPFALALLMLMALVTVPRSAAPVPPAGRVVRLGLLFGISPSFDPSANPIHRALVEGLRAHGYEPGRNIVFEFRSAQGNPERLPGLAAELARLKVDVLVTFFTVATLAAREATQTVPIVMVGAADPVGTGLVASLARPGGNITGLGVNAAEISAKRVQLLQEAVPRLSRVAVLWNSTLKSMALGFQQIELAAPSLGVTVQSVRVSGSADFDQAFAAIGQARPGGLIVLFGPMRGNDLPRIVEFVTRNRLPTVFELGQGVRGGGLMEFGPNLSELGRQVGGYIDKIVNGAKPADLPVEEPTKFELVINLKAARTLGLPIPQSLLLRADRVVEEPNGR